jgi:allantoinase
MTSEAFDLVIAGDVVTPDLTIADGYVAVRDGRIAALGQGELPVADKTENHAGCLLMPGLVDAQVHAGSHAGIPGLRDATRGAAAGGVTTIVDMPFDEPNPVNNIEALEAKIAAIRTMAVVDVALYVTARKGGNPRELRDLASRGACAVKLSTYEYHPVRFPRFTTGEMYEIFLEAAALGLPVSFHNEDQELVNHFLAKTLAEGDTSSAAHGASRPPIAEMVANAQILELAYHTGVRCHIVHSSVAGGFELVRQYRSRGAKVTAETCLQYLIFNENDMVRQGAFLKQNPPIRPEGDRAALWKCLERGEIDFVSTDHVAWPIERKNNPDIFKNGSGVPGLETLLPVFYTAAVKQHGLAPSVIARVSARNPAQHFGLYPRKGHLGVGADADVAVVRPVSGVFDQTKMTSEVKWSPYDGLRVAGEVAATYLRGAKIFENGAVLNKPGHGQFIRPEAPLPTPGGDRR